VPPIFHPSSRLRLFFHASFLLLLAAVLLSIIALIVQTARASARQQLAEVNLFLERVADERELANYILFRNQIVLATRTRPVVPLYYPEPLYSPFYTDEDAKRGTARLPRWRPPPHICVAPRPVTAEGLPIANDPLLVMNVCAVVNEQGSSQRFLEIALKFFDLEFVPGGANEPGDRLMLDIFRAGGDSGRPLRSWTLSFEPYVNFPGQEDFVVHKLVAHANDGEGRECGGASNAGPGGQSDCAIEGQVFVPRSQPGDHWTVVMLRIAYDALHGQPRAASAEWPPKDVSHLLIRVGRIDVDARGRVRHVRYATEGDSLFSLEDIVARLGPQGEYFARRTDTGQVLWQFSKRPAPPDTVRLAGAGAAADAAAADGSWTAGLLTWMGRLVPGIAEAAPSTHRRLGHPMFPMLAADVSVDSATWPPRIRGSLRFEQDPAVELLFTTADAHPAPALVDTAVRLLAGILVLTVILYVVIAQGVINRLVALFRHAALVAQAVRGGAHGALASAALASDAPPFGNLLKTQDEIGVLARSMQDLLEAEHARSAEEAARLIAEHERRERELDRQRLLAEAEKAQLDANKSRLEVIGHDIRSPLNSLNHFMEMLPDSVEHRDHALRMFRRMKRAIVNLSETEDAISSVPLLRERQDLALKLRELVQYSWMDNVDNVRYEGPHEGVMVDADAGVLAEAVDFIIENAHRERAPGTPILIRLNASRSRASFSIENEGSHIAEENLERIFEYGFSTRKSEGEGENLGRGLYRARLIFSMHGGTVSARNSARGVAFDVVLPLATAASPPQL